MDIATFAGLDENHPVYRDVTSANHDRLIAFLKSMVEAALVLERPEVTHHLIRAFNSHAIAGLHSAAGQYRSVSVLVGNHVPPEPERVGPLMDDFVVDLERRWNASGAVSLAAWALWRVNFIHPFINGNGRTARALCYYIMCVKLGMWLPGAVTLPNLLRARGEAYYGALRLADEGDLQPLTNLLLQVLDEQLQQP